MSTYKKLLLSALLLWGIGQQMHVDVWFVPTAHAQSTTWNDFNASEKDLSSGKFMASVLTGLNVMAWISFDLLDKLLDPALMFQGEGDGSANGNSRIEDTLNKIWVLCRNIMNIIFAVALLLAAIYTVITANNEMVKSHLGKFVMSVVLVNFSWLFPLMVLDFANMMTSVVLSLPSEVAADAGDCRLPKQKGETEGKKCEIVSDVVYFPTEKTDTTDPTASDSCDHPTSVEVAEGCFYKCFLKLVCYKTEPWDTDESKTPFKKVINGLVFNYAKLGDIARLPNVTVDAQGSNLQQWLMFVIRQGLVIVIHIALVFPLIAMVLAFIMRIPVLWLTIAFMPFIFAWVLFHDVPNLGSGTEEVKKNILDNFIGAAFLPVKVAVPLTVGFIMMNALAGANWAILDKQLDRKLALTGGVTTFFDILWLAMALGIMWTGTFKALESSGGAFATVGAWVKSAGEGVGKLAVGLPLKAPVVPGIGMTVPQLLSNLKNPSGFAGAIVTGGDVKHPGSTFTAAEVQKVKAEKPKVDKQIIDTKVDADLDKLVEVLKETSGNNKITRDTLVEHLDKLAADKAITLNSADRTRIDNLVQEAKKAKGGK